jgi:hypothetical protein
MLTYADEQDEPSLDDASLAAAAAAKHVSPPIASLALAGDLDPDTVSL